jgi:hypothetical protein
MAALTGVIRGSTVLLDHSVPSLEGRRVVVLVQTSDDATLSKAEQDAAWKAWAGGPLQGPIDDVDPSFP